MGQVSGFQLKSAEARRLQKLDQRPVQVRIDNNLQVNLITSGGGDTCRIEFTYAASYGALGVIKMDGEFTYAGPLAAQCAADWGTKRQMPGEAASEIHTAIMHACVPEAVGLARLVQLPPPIPLPTVKFEKPPEKLAPHSSGPEVS